MNIVAELIINTLGAHGGWVLPNYSEALIAACRSAPPPFGTKEYGKIYRDVARDPSWMAISLRTRRGRGMAPGICGT